ncbi:sulfite exporter TauE/SafE family protein [Rhodovulum sp. DZ06]|uniref:sulfite exporter TauE/SafE family protein n=1 Tax=Rhodovulum sp. DZ06 TaxID=3425126 RepID=UPI003D33274A
MSALLSAMAEAASAPGFPLLVLACALAGVVRGFSGFGTALVFMPAATAVLPGAVALMALQVFDTPGALSLVPKAWKDCDRKVVARLSAGFLLGVPAGVALLASLDAAALRWLIGAMALAAAAALATGLRLPPGLPDWVAAPVGAASGVFAGVAGLAGVPVVLWQLARDEAPARMRATIIVFFMVGTALSCATLALAGLATLQALALGLLLLPPYMLAIQGGRLLFPLAPEAWFRRAAFGLITASALLGLPLWD